MSKQAEYVLEEQLVQQLQTLGYELVVIKDENDLLANLKKQLEKHNKVQLSDTEFRKVLNHLSKGNVFDKAERLRDKFQFKRENGDVVYLEFLNLEYWCQNQYQVTHQVSMEGRYKNRYDVTLLINGLPLVQIELKRRGLELKEAFNQINRYQRHSFDSSYGLFQYIQIFVISNGVNTKYYANNRRQEFKQTFFWADANNKKITHLEAFANVFLEKCHLSKMICKYIVLHQSNKILMVLRPYQYYATEAIVERVKNSQKNGYIWHTTGSGKTLTSFKTSQVLMDNPKIHKIIFVVDRRDLDDQTTKEFNHFVEDSVDSTTNTKTLVDQFTDTYKTPKGVLKTAKLIVTTIQKLNNAISSSRHLKRMETERDKRFVFIFDECHRSQFGDTHQRIVSFFNNAQLFGFTGTPILAENAVSKSGKKQTTKDLFGDCLHKYVITDAIRDENVLKFSIEYVGRYKQKEGYETELDIKVEDIDTKELYESQERLEKITDYIIANHKRKTHGRFFSAMFCVSSIEILVKYYQLFQSKKEAGKHNLRIATIFSYGTNEEDKEADGHLDDESFPSDGIVNQHSRDQLEAFIQDYNTMYQTDYSTKDSQSFYNYYRNIAKRLKDREKTSFQDKDRLDILLVVNMFLTGFDAKKVNTLYVDKNLKHHGLIQAFSRTNRIIGEKKSQGNIMCFRNLKKATDDAIALFSNPEAKEVIMMEPYEVYVKRFNEALIDLKAIVPTVDSVDDLLTEEDELAFVKAFRSLIRLMNILSHFADFSYDDLDISEQEYKGYKSKYLYIHRKVRFDRQKEKVSILQDVDFELELIHRDEVNVTYIIKLLRELAKAKNKAKKRQQILDFLNTGVELRSKKELIEKFINNNLPNIKDEDQVEGAFHVFWQQEKQKALQSLCEEENLYQEQVEKVIEDFLFTGRRPLRDAILATLKETPRLMQRKTVTENLTNKIMEFVDIYVDGVPLEGENL